MKRVTGLIALLVVFACAMTSHGSPQAAQAPPDTEIYLASVKSANGVLEIGPAVKITNNAGYDNQPFFTPDGGAVLFTSMRGMVNGTTLYSWRRGQSGWKEVMALERLSLTGITRLAVSPKGDYLALVGPPRQSR